MAPYSSTLGLENPRDRGAWWAAVYGVTQSWTRDPRKPDGPERFAPRRNLDGARRGQGGPRPRESQMGPERSAPPREPDGARAVRAPEKPRWGRGGPCPLRNLDGARAVCTPKKPRWGQGGPHPRESQKSWTGQSGPRSQESGTGLE